MEGKVSKMEKMRALNALEKAGIITREESLRLLDTDVRINADTPVDDVVTWAKQFN